MKKYILLDWDGNLAKTLDVWLEAVRIPMQQRGLELSDNEIGLSFGAPHEYFEKWGVTDIDTAIDEMDALSKRLLPDVELYPDAVFVLEELQKRGAKMALITSSPRDNVVRLLDKYDMHHYFDVIIANEDTEKHKPHPEPLEKALALFGASKDEAIMIGDSDKDIGAGSNAGVDTILFHSSEHGKFYSLEDLKSLHPTHIVDDFRQVLDIV